MCQNCTESQKSFDHIHHLGEEMMSAIPSTEATPFTTSSHNVNVVRANSRATAKSRPTVSPDTIGEIRLNYRLAKSAEDTRIRIDHGLTSFARVYLTGWLADGDELSRTKCNTAAREVIKAIRKGDQVSADNQRLYESMVPMVLGAEPARDLVEKERKARRKMVENMVKELPAWEALEQIRGFSAWGLGAVIGEAGDIGMYSGCRKLYKRLGLAPNECYERGEKSTGRKIPRASRGRVMGILADPLLRAQWRGEKDGVIAHAIGPYGLVYGDAKLRHLAAGKTKGHAHNLARRAMIKALLHDIHKAWHGESLTYAWKIVA